MGLLLYPLQKEQQTTDCYNLISFMIIAMLVLSNIGTSTTLLLQMLLWRRLYTTSLLHQQKTENSFKKCSELFFVYCTAKTKGSAPEAAIYLLPLLMNC